MKPPIPIFLAVEDELSEFVLRRLLQERPITYALGAVFRRGGFGYLKKQTPAFNNMAKAAPLLLLTDLDTQACPPALLADWLPHTQHRDFLLRVAVRKVEAWLLPQQAGLAGFLGIRQDHLTNVPETLHDPKAELLKLAQKSPRRDKREALVRVDANGGRRQGPAYNSTLAEFVSNEWEVDAAAKACPSLLRLLKALAELERNWKDR